MLGSLPTEAREALTLGQIEAIAESIAYVAPENVEQRRAEIIANIRRLLRDWRAGQ